MGTRRDAMPTYPGWQPSRYCPEQRPTRRRETNNRASRKRHATTRHLQIGERVIIKDRKPSWKFCKLYEQGVWTISRVASTMDTARKVSKTVPDGLMVPESDIRRRTRSGLPSLAPVSEDQEPQDMRDRDPTNVPGTPSSPKVTHKRYPKSDRHDQKRPEIFRLCRKYKNAEALGSRRLPQTLGCHRWQTASAQEECPRAHRSEATIPH
ncbi:hypothetical protein NDU88_011403 [Pleurodeles waltl]|uniref:Uncharacterized protein n=1 Tax=Pleurodeles waltl TaxID=8319 RepID=A0AAV7QXI0_PLEWA|nr:hypothetical protein NDU88_011403 [Pleurodeles waltl]